MRAILEFNLPEDRDDYTAASKGKLYYLALLDYSNWLRDKLKYQTGGMSDEVYEALEEAREAFFESMSDYGVSTEDLP